MSDVTETAKSTNFHMTLTKRSAECHSSSKASFDGSTVCVHEPADGIVSVSSATLESFNLDMSGRGSRRNSRRSLNSEKFSDIHLNHARSLQDLSDVRNLSNRIHERIQSVSDLMSSKSSNIRSHLELMRETKERYNQLEKRLKLAAQLMESDTCIKKCDMPSRPMSRASSTRSITPIFEADEGPKRHYAQHQLHTSSLAKRRVTSPRDTSTADEADSESSASPRQLPFDETPSEFDSGFEVEPVGRKSTLDWARYALHSRSALKANNEKVSRDEIMERYLQKRKGNYSSDTFHKPQSADNSSTKKPIPCQRSGYFKPILSSDIRTNKEQLKLKIGTKNCFALKRLEGSIIRDRYLVAHQTSPRYNSDDDGLSASVASRWSSVSNTRGARPIPAQCFEPDSTSTLDVSASSNLSTRLSSEWVNTNFSRKQKSTTRSNQNLYRSTMLGHNNNLPIHTQDVTVMRWSSMPDLLDETNASTEELDRCFGTPATKRKNQSSSKQGKIKSKQNKRPVLSTISSNGKNHTDDIFQTDESKHKKNKSRLRFLKRSSKNHRTKLTISGPTEAYPIARQVTTRHHTDSLHQVELHRPVNGPYEFYLQRGYKQHQQGIFVGKLSGKNSKKFLSGLLNEGDEIVKINNRFLKSMRMDEIHCIMEASEKLLLTVLPYSSRNDT